MRLLIFTRASHFTPTTHDELGEAVGTKKRSRDTAIADAVEIGLVELIDGKYFMSDPDLIAMASRLGTQGLADRARQHHANERETYLFERDRISTNEEIRYQEMIHRLRPPRPKKSFGKNDKGKFTQKDL